MLLALVLGVLIATFALLRGGSLESLSRTRFRWVPLLAAALVIQIGSELWSPEWLSGGVALGMLLGTNAAVVVFLVLNRRIPGMVVAAVGLALNVAVIAANGAMPVSERAAELAGVEGLSGDTRIKHEELDQDTVLPWLADVIPIPVPVLNQVISIGDIVLALGIGRLVYVRTTNGKRDGRAGELGGDERRTTPASD